MIYTPEPSFYIFFTSKAGLELGGGLLAKYQDLAHLLAILAS